MAKNMTQRGKVDLEGLRGAEVQAMKDLQPPADMPFRIGGMGHAVLVVRDIDASVRFYTQVLGFKVSDVYPESMVPGRMVFMRFNEDHHGLGVIGQGEETSSGPRTASPGLRGPHPRRRLPRPGLISRSTASPSTSTAAGVRAARCRWSSGIPTATAWKSSGGSTRWIGTARRAPPEEWAPRPSLEKGARRGAAGTGYDFGRSGPAAALVGPSACQRARTSCSLDLTEF